jgi:hypothetical protein
MATSPNSYGTAARVAALTPLYTSVVGNFDTETNPTLATVESWIDQVSAALNVALANTGFVIPVSQATAGAMLAGFVEGHVARMVEGVNGRGRFAADRDLTLTEYSLALTGIAEAWVKAMAAGLKALGVDVIASALTGVTVGAAGVVRSDSFSESATEYATGDDYL